MRAPSSCAFIRLPAKSIANAISQNKNGERPDPELFMKQHELYVEALRKMGLKIYAFDADENFPDGNFIEDDFLLLRTEDYPILIELNPGAATRRREPEGIDFPDEFKFQRIVLDKTYTIDGGDVLEDRNTLYVGISKRTELEAIEELERLVTQFGYNVRALPVPEGLHLKSGMTCMKPGHFLVQSGFEPLIELLKKTDPTIKHFVVPDNEAHAANVLAVNDKILVPDSCPVTRDYLLDHFAQDNVIEVDTRQARLVDGALTCSCLVI